MSIDSRVTSRLLAGGGGGGGGDGGMGGCLYALDSLTNHSKNLFCLWCIITPVLALPNPSLKQYILQANPWPESMI